MRLNERLKEESTECLECQDTENQIEELADMLEVILEIARVKGVTSHELEAVQRQKADTQGAFEERILLEWVED